MFNQTLNRVNYLLSISIGVAIAALFLALPTGTFWPISFSNISFTTAIVLLPFCIMGFYVRLKNINNTNYRWFIISVIGSILTAFGYLAMAANNIYPPTGNAWIAFMTGFLLLGVGIVFVVLQSQALSASVRRSLLAVSISSIFIFTSSQLFGAYPFGNIIWAAFGASIVSLGYSIANKAKQTTNQTM